MVSSGSAPFHVDGHTHRLVSQFDMQKIVLLLLLFVFLIATFQFLPKHSKKDGKVDWARSFFEHLIELFLFDIQATYRSKHKDTKWILYKNVLCYLSFIAVHYNTV